MCVQGYDLLQGTLVRCGIIIGCCRALQIMLQLTCRTECPKLCEQLTEPPRAPPVHAMQCVQTARLVLLMMLPRPNAQNVSLATDDAAVPLAAVHGVAGAVRVTPDMHVVTCVVTVLSC